MLPNDDAQHRPRLAPEGTEQKLQEAENTGLALGIRVNWGARLITGGDKCQGPKYLASDIPETPAANAFKSSNDTTPLPFVAYQPKRFPDPSSSFSTKKRHLRRNAAKNLNLCFPRVRIYLFSSND